jgi:hypothetical protein
MREPRNSRSNANRAVPFQAAFLLLLAGLGTAAYFVEFRGAGFATLAAAETAPELVIVGGALVALALVSYLGISRALSTVPGEANVRGILRHALTLADAAPEEIEDELETLPSEIQDLVRMLVAQRLRSDGTGREIQSLRHEINAIQQGMQRSALSLEPMHLDGAGEIGRAVAGIWNQMLERVQSPPTETMAAVADSSAQLEVRSLRQRLEALESRCGRLEEEMLSVQTSTPAGIDSGFGSGTPDLILEDASMASAPQDPAPAWQEPTLPTADAVQAPEGPTTSSPSGYHEWTGHASAGDWKLHREAQETFAKEGDAAGQSPAGLETSFTSEAAGDLVLEPSDSSAPPAQPFVDDTYPLEAETPGAPNRPSSEFSFPHFVGKPGAPDAPDEGRVEVTFEGKRQRTRAPRDEELSVDPDGSATRPGSVIFDLRSLGAVELDD